MPLKEMRNPDKSELVQRIRRAWAGATYPGDDNIFTPESYDDEGITEYFSGTSWEGHDVANLRARETALTAFFTPAAYHYWRPAYLIAAVENPDELSQGVDSLVHSLVPHDEPSWFKTEQHKRLQLLTHEQKVTALNVLEYLAWKYGKDEDIGLALEYLYELTAKA